MLRVVAIIGVVAIASLSGSRAVQAFDGVSNAMPPQPKSSVVTKWRIMQVQLTEDAVRLAACRAEPEACSLEQKGLEEIVDRGRLRAGRARVGVVNRAINLTIRPMSDWQQYGMRDHWASPLETLRTGAGDCEDYAILKYLALREAGFAADDLQLVIVRDIVARADHAMLAVRVERHWLVLDNRNFVLADLQSALHLKRYRVVARFGPDADVPDYASVAAMAPDFLM